MSGIVGIDALKKVEDFDPKERELDPHAIFKAHIEAVGGAYNVSNDRNFYTTGEIDMNHTKYAFEERGMKPLKNRLDLLKDDEVVYSSGDNGFFLWVENGENISKYPDMSKERDLNIAREKLDYMNPESEYFSVESAKKKLVNGKQVYEIEVSNKMNDDKNFYYFDAKTFMLNKEKYERNGKTVETFYSNYKDIGGIKKAHRVETKDLTRNKYELKNIRTYRRNLIMDRSIFDVPEKEEDTGISFNAA